MGLFSPVLVRGKVLLQTLWSKHLEWDDKLNTKDEQAWMCIKEDLQKVCEIEIPRCISIQSGDGCLKYKLLCFCDASSSAYAATIYLNQSNKEEERTDLVFAKTRLAPCKKMTIPRLELMAVLIGVRSIEFVKSQLSMHINEVCLYTDSQCVLKWLTTDKAISTFVQNRIQEIKNHHDITFFYVQSKKNPADIASRGTTVDKLNNNLLWWHGPQPLPTQERDLTQSMKPCSQSVDDEFESEIRPKKQVGLVSTETKVEETRSQAPLDIDSERFSSLSKLLRVTALSLRFINKLRKRKVDCQHITSTELKFAERLWLLHVQHKHFHDVNRAIKNKRRNNLQEQLGVHIDNEGLLRCTGRLAHADLSEAAKYPILLPKNDRFTHLLIERIHKQLLHSGISQTLSSVRQRFWITNGRSTVRMVLLKCTTCRKYDGGSYKFPNMPPLPENRVKECTPFSKVGLDYLGPLFIRTSDGIKKVWVCLFTCFVTRAVHLESVQDMSTNEFLLGLRRFIAQRGTPGEILSDNASQFKLASDTLKLVWNKVLKSDDVQSYVSSAGIKWTFIVELAPWMGGFYERLVGVVKRPLRKSIGRTLLTNSQLCTLLKEVEAVVNSRPLVYISDDIDSNITLTPAMFLTLNPDIGIPEQVQHTDDPDYVPRENSAQKLLSLWKKGQKLLNLFWKLWREEYLLSLRERTQTKIKSKRIQAQVSPRVNDVVLIKDDLPRGQWKIAKIVELRVSRDGNVRSAKVKTPSGRILQRPLTLLFPVETNGQCVHESESVKGLPASEKLSINRRSVRAAAVKANNKIKTLFNT